MLSEFERIKDSGDHTLGQQLLLILVLALVEFAPFTEPFRNLPNEDQHQDG